MPRMARVVLAGYPHHVVQRDHNWQVAFAEAGDCPRYLATLEEFKGTCSVKVYAWCLMTSHVRLLLAPSDAAGLGQLMKRLTGWQTRDHERWSGAAGLCPFSPTHSPWRQGTSPGAGGTI
jgi:putative transposase